MAEMIEPIGKVLVPFWNLSENYKVWVPDFVNMEKAVIQYQELKAELEKIKKAPRTRADQIKFLEKAYAEYQKKITAELAALMTEKGADAFSRLPYLQNNPINSIIPQDIFKAALEQLPPDPSGALTDSQRQKKLEDYRKKETELIEIIKEMTPQSYIQFKNGNVQCDSRVEFVRFWREKQAWIARPCNVQGLDLTVCADDEKWAYEKLGIAKSILAKATKLPYRPD